MQVTFLGTGSAMPTGERVQAGILLEADGQTLLVDCGSGVLHRLAQVADYEATEHVLLTHHHLDHCSDLMALLKARWLAGAESLSVAGPPGTEALVTGLLDVHDYLQGRVDLSVRDVTEGEFSFAGFDVTAMQTRHSMTCFAYRFGDDFCFSGDSEAFSDLVAFAEGCDVLAHDCSFPDEVDVSNHPTPGQLGDVLAGADLGTVYLTHLYPHTDSKHDAMLASIGERYDGRVEFADDGHSVSL